MMNEYDVVIIIKTINNENLPIGSRGTILQVYNNPIDKKAYLIEFITDYEKGSSIITFISEDDFDKIEKVK